MNEFAHLRSLFLLDPEITFLNFGSFGACPRSIFEDYQRWQLELEREPIQFILYHGENNLRISREALAEYIHCNPDDLVYTVNPSYAINIIAKSLKLERGDEVLSTNLEYGALDRTWNYYCRKRGAIYRRQKISLPVRSKDEIVEQFFAAYSEKTKAIFISHITSATALRLPVEVICRKAKEKGLLTIVDGAHVPGHIPLDLSKLEADIYTGACHKWMMTPKGCSFLYVKREFQSLFDPLVVSWGYEAATPSNSQFIDYHQMQGTRDFSAFLTVPKAIEFMTTNNWDEVAAACRKLVGANVHTFCTLLNTEPISPVTEEFLGQMCSIPVRTKEPEKLQRYLFEQYKIEVPIMRQDSRTFLRYSINAFNRQEDLDKLYEALKEIKNTTTLLS